jgi:hypothetical protein
LLIFSLIGSSQAFELQQIMTGGGPGGASRTVVLYLYTLLQQLRFADATALGVLLFIGVMAIVVVYRIFVNDDPDAPLRSRRNPFRPLLPGPRQAAALDEEGATGRRPEMTGA